MKVQLSLNSLEDALAAAEEGSTITLNENITVTQRAYITKGITLNGNGHSIAVWEISLPPRTRP